MATRRTPKPVFIDELAQPLHWLLSMPAEINLRPVSLTLWPQGRGGDKAVQQLRRRYALRPLSLLTADKIKTDADARGLRDVEIEVLGTLILVRFVRPALTHEVLTELADEVGRNTPRPLDFVLPLLQEESVTIRSVGHYCDWLKRLDTLLGQVQAAYMGYKAAARRSESQEALYRLWVNRGRPGCSRLETLANSPSIRLEAENPDSPYYGLEKKSKSRLSELIKQWKAEEALRDRQQEPLLRYSENRRGDVWSWSRVDLLALVPDTVLPDLNEEEAPAE